MGKVALVHVRLRCSTINSQAKPLSVIIKGFWNITKGWWKFQLGRADNLLLFSNWGNSGRRNCLLLAFA
jgi:hypothetical protein